MNTYLKQTCCLDLSCYENVRYVYHIWYDTESGPDFLERWYSTNGGSTWIWAAQWTGNSGGWDERSVTISSTIDSYCTMFSFFSNGSIHDYEGAYVDGIVVTGDPILPDAPSLTYPPDIGDDLPTTITFDWGSVSGATSYHLQVSTSSSFSSPEFDINGISSSQYQITDLCSDEFYYWRVSASDECGTSAWSTIWEFDTQELSAPSPVFPRPGDSILGPVTFEWDPINEATLYNLEVDDNSGFPSPLHDIEVECCNVTLGNFQDYTPYYWRLRAKDCGDYGEWSETVAFNITTFADEGKDPVPGRFELTQNFPNPFNPSTEIQFSLPRSEFVTIRVFSTLGDQVDELVSAHFDAGTYSISWNAADLASGVYFYRISAGDFVQTRRALLVK
jgi:hypothetical protein